jgi:trigger factor
VADNEELAEGGTAVLDEQGEAPLKMDLQVEIQDAGPCKKHVKITIPRADIDRVMDDQVGELVTSAEVPGFRPGHVPDALIRRRFKKELAEKVKQQLLMLSLDQMAQGDQLDPINEPNLDVDGIELPDDGDFTYQFDVEVRPEFDLPDYKGLKIERPVRDLTAADVDAYTARFLDQYAQLTPVDEPARAGDIVIVDAAFTHNGEPVREFRELSLRVRPTVRFHDAEIKGFDKLLVGAKADDVRETDVKISMEADKLELRGETVHVRFTVLDVKRMVMPTLDEEFFARVNAVDEADLKQQFRQMLERQVQYEQRQATRRQVLDRITAAADWDLPEDLVRKQVENAMRREVLEMQQAGFTTPEIRAREGRLRQNSISTARKNLKQHFVLDRIADAEKIEVVGSDIELEIAMMAMQAGENVRRVRSRLIKSGLMENLEAQIRERKAVDVILEHAQFKDVPMSAPADLDVEAVNRSIGSEIADTDVDEEDEGEEG